MLTIEHVTKTFYKGTVNERKALDNISLHVAEGDFVTIIGSNGAGKSTLFNMITGDFLVDSGCIVLDGKDLTFEKDYKRARTIGKVFQDPLKGTAPHMTIEENLALAYMRTTGKQFRIGMRRKDCDFFRDKLAKLDLGLETRMKTRVGTLSGGQRQAVTLMMSTLVTPKLLLLDEHTAALDPATADKVLAMTAEVVATHHITTMMITHNIASALSLGNRTIMMHEGRIIMDLKGEERRAMTPEKLLERFKEKVNQGAVSDRMLFA